MVIFTLRNTQAALKCALRLVQYEKELDSKEVYRLIALSALLNKSYKECSKALSKLEHMTELTKKERKQYQELAISIFTQNEPENLKEKFFKCPGKGCEEEISELYYIPLTIVTLTVSHAEVTSALV